MVFWPAAVHCENFDGVLTLAAIERKSRPELDNATTGGLVPPQLASALYRFIVPLRAFGCWTVKRCWIFGLQREVQRSRNVPI
jgi:hypothetical protein